MDDVIYSFTDYNPAAQIIAKVRNNNLYAFNGYVATNRAYVTNGLNQYTSSGGTTLAYEANGNLRASGTMTYSYDVENRLIGISGPASPALVYDPLGRLYEVQGAATRRFLHDGDELVGEYNTAGTMLARYVHGMGEDNAVVWYNGATMDAGTRRYLHADQQGSIVAASDAGGNRLAINSYDEYGIPGFANTGMFQYTGQVWLPEIGLYYYKARMYSPTLGRFMQTDPIGYKDQNNLYAYVTNDPINSRDPTGNQTLPDDTAAQVQALRQIGKSDAEIRDILSKQAEADRGAAYIVFTGTSAVIPIERVFSVLGGLAKALGLGERGATVATEVTVASSKNLLGQVTENLAAKGFDAPKIKEAMGWGERASGASARLESMNGASAAAQVRGTGMTKSMVQSLREGYADAAARGRGVGVAPLRVQILDKILKNW